MSTWGSARIFLLEALVVLYSLTAAAFRSDKPSIATDARGLVRLAIPAAAALVGLGIRDRLARNKTRSPHDTVIDVLAAYGLALLSQAALMALAPEWILPRWAPTQGGFVGIILLAICRSLFPPNSREVRSEPALLADWELESLARRARRFKRVCVASTAAAGVLGAYLLTLGLVRARAAGTFLLVGALYLAALTARRDALTHTADEDLRALRRQLRGLLVWCYASLLPALVLLLWGTMVYLYWAPLVILIFAELTHRSLERLGPASGTVPAL